MMGKGIRYISRSNRIESNRIEIGSESSNEIEIEIE